MENIKTPASTNQIRQNKPNIPKTAIPLKGFIATSMNGGHNKTIAWKKCMAGEKHYEYRVKLKIKTLTPLTPAYQQLKCTVKAYYVPNQRVWKNAEKYTAQKGGTTTEKIETIPYWNGLIPRVSRPTPNDNIVIPITQTDVWRDSFISSYYPKIGLNETKDIAVNPDAGSITAPQVSILPLRGRVAIYNDYERNKEYDTEEIEYNTDTVSNTEINSYMPTKGNRRDFYNMRAKRPNNYYTNYRTEYQGIETTAPNTSNQTENLIKWADWEAQIAEARAQAENSQKNDWEIIAQLRGSKVLTEGKVQLIGQKTFNLNYAAITQSTYNQNENVREEFQVMGTQGAYSYTEIDTPIYAGFETVEEGYIHIIATVWADTIFESGIDRNLLNITPLDEYRPDLIDQKFDVLYRGENGTTISQQYKNVIGYKRKFNEYFKLPNCISGDLTTTYYKQTKNYQNTDTYLEETSGGELIDIITQNTYQFFETDRYAEPKKAGGIIEGMYKKIWKDYTDLQLNKNQAIENEIEIFNGTENTIRVKGQNQIDILGYATLTCELPIDESIVSNYTEWGEH